MQEPRAQHGTHHAFPLPPPPQFSGPTAQSPKPSNPQAPKANLPTVATLHQVCQDASAAYCIAIKHLIAAPGDAGGAAAAASAWAERHAHADVRGWLESALGPDPGPPAHRMIGYVRWGFFYAFRHLRSVVSGLPSGRAGCWAGGKAGGRVGAGKRAGAHSIWVMCGKEGGKEGAGRGGRRGGKDRQDREGAHKAVPKVPSSCLAPLPQALPGPLPNWT